MIIQQLIMQTPTLNNFADNDVLTIFDLSLDEDGAAVTSNGYNATFRATGATIVINSPDSGSPSAVTHQLLILIPPIMVQQQCRKR